MRRVQENGWLRHARLVGMGLVLLLGSFLPFAAPLRATPMSQGDKHPIPVLAYYYIWFDSGSWERAKKDYPLLGMYSSDDRAVMEQHIKWAKQAHIDGFIVSWKSTEKLNRRLKQLIEVAEAEDFKLSIIYQGLNFERDPLPSTQIAADLDYFEANFAASPVFSMFAHPVVIWSGTWKFSPDEINTVAASRRDNLLILASERNVKDYERLAAMVDGNAYYWSSVNPSTFPSYQEKLNEMAAAVRKEHGLWIAPAASGFDARMIGGTREVERADGARLTTQINAAIQSSPDAVGLISWNEFSENSHIEPSVKYGYRYLELLKELQQTSGPIVTELDSSEPAGLGLPFGSTLLAFSAMGILILTCTTIIFVRRRSRDS